MESFLNLSHLDLVALVASNILAASPSKTDVDVEFAAETACDLVEASRKQIVARHHAAQNRLATHG